MTTLANIHLIQADWALRTRRLFDLVNDTPSSPNPIQRDAIRRASEDVHQIVLQVTEILSTHQQVKQKHKSEMIRAAALSSLDTLCFSFGALGLISSQDQQTKDRYPWLEGVSIGALAVSQIASKVNDYFHLKKMREERNAHQDLIILQEILRDPTTEKIWGLFGISKNEEMLNQTLTEDQWSIKRRAFLDKETRSVTLSLKQDERTPLLS
jgi:hypothetical protein